jgi:meso-butanediol dehydrogenase / (S,S)-butanediol dehydrogenase / diacetyl reductase
MMRLTGKVALITGAGRGTGRAACLVFASEGAKIVAAEIDEELGRETVSLVTQQGGQAIFAKCDVASEKQVKASVEAGVKAFGRLDILYNNAGVLWPNVDMDITTLEEDVLDKVLGINLKGAIWVCKHGIPELLKAGGGSIINISSVCAVGSSAGYPVPAYSASKGAVISLTKALGQAYADKNIRANVILPGIINTLLTGPMTEEEKKPALKMIPMHRRAEPEEIARIALFLASDDSSYMTCSEIIADGGTFTFMGIA